MGTSAITRDAMMRAIPGGPGSAIAPPSPFLGVLPPEMWDKPKRFWTQPFSAVAALAAAGVASPNFQVDPNLHFVGYYGMATIRANAAGKAIQTGYPLTVSLHDNNNRYFNPASLPNDVNNLFGTASQPSVWGVPVILAPGTTLTADITNTGATTIDVWLAIAGFLVSL